MTKLAAAVGLFSVVSLGASTLSGCGPTREAARVHFLETERTDAVADGVRTTDLAGHPRCVLLGGYLTRPPRAIEQT